MLQSPAVDEENATRSCQELYQEINDLTKNLETSEFKGLSGRERRRLNSLIREKRRKLEQILICQGMQILKTRNESYH